MLEIVKITKTDNSCNLRIDKANTQAEYTLMTRAAIGRRDKRSEYIRYVVINIVANSSHLQFTRL